MNILGINYYSHDSSACLVMEGKLIIALEEERFTRNKHTREFFDIDVEAPFMLKVCDVFPDKRELLPAITHVDGSARLQTVCKETNTLYHALITKFGEKSGFPVVLNTSFNIQGEPVVESPRDAVRCFFSTGLDKLVIENYVVSK